MPYRYTIDPNAGRAVIVGEGASNLEEAEAAIRRLAADPAHRPSHSMLCDFLALDYTPSVSDAWEFAGLFGALRASYAGRIALLVASPGQLAAAHALAAILALSGITVRGFRDRDAALDWLDGRTSLPLERP